MHSRLPVWLALLGIACASIAPQGIHAQLPPWLKNCLPSPTFADEIQGMLNEEQLKAAEGKQVQPEIHIVAVTFEGADALPESNRAQITAKLEQPTFDNDSELLDFSRECVRDALRDRGYFYPTVNAKTNMISSDSKEKRAALTVQVSEGTQYRLTEIRFANAHEFPTTELRKLFPLENGGIFNVSGIRVGIERLTWLYGTRGYINFTASPVLDVDNSDRRISVTMDLNEDRQFRVGSVEILGLEKEIAEHAVKVTLHPGEIFSSESVGEFYKENKAILPFVTSLGEFKERTQIGQNTKESTVSVVFDLRHCP